ncbi:MAG: hypothetical protein O7G31_14535 [Calditrichaeota bacterium]|nr:hypothetical protein [Calditrichota bacterium]
MVGARHASTFCEKVGFLVFGKKYSAEGDPAGVPPNGGFYDSCASAPPLEEAPAARAGHRRTASPDQEAGAGPETHHV